MYTFLCQLCHSLHKRPKTVVFFSLLLTIFFAYFASQLEIKTSLTQALPSQYESVKLMEKMEEQFGGLGKLTVILKSKDSALNKKTLLKLVQNLKNHPDINLLDYKKEKEFFDQYQLLYISLIDL